MAKKARVSKKKKAGTSKVEQTTHYAVYDRRSGELVTVHHVTLMAGARALSGDVIQKRVLTCAALAFERPRAALRVTATARPIDIKPRAQGDVSKGKMQSAETDPRVTP
jgi:hypothetical protein